MKLLKILALSALSLGAVAPAMAQDTFVSIGSNPVGNAAYQWAAGIADLINRNVDGVQMTAEGTKGYVANVRLMLDSQIEAGFSNSKLAYEAYLGEGDYADVEPGQILSWMSIAPIVQHVVVMEDSDIMDLSDLAGRRVGIGQPGGTSMLDAEILLEAIGLTPGEDFTDFRVNLGQMETMLSDGQIDAFMWNGSIPLPPIIKLTSQNDIRILPIPTDVSDAIRAQYPAYSEGDLPANTYEDQPDAVPSYRLGNVLLIRADVDEEIVYQATKTVMENLDHMATVHPAWGRVSADSILGGFNAPLHPGALRYYREAGVPGIEEFVTRTAN
ncbi:putative TAXI family TRAP transporter solute receptor [Octadecabacter arcticus 238]|uniref:Putative TAXI family TRAP transporter solute receptor n=1 Tax=Octadecabacter arcticus 238 TaxID=391616 RepID=M9RPR0_9RHOB|nr:TAXI family TRAP transporter solute-binding subunit [Octadecabacter arcticus]AGI74589.1 putative TAXI family TRAP transporter solute receptor [Octadecabacter arcticus 238]